jgi:hypothetical protein
MYLFFNRIVASRSLREQRVRTEAGRVLMMARELEVLLVYEAWLRTVPTQCQVSILEADRYRTTAIMRYGWISLPSGSSTLNNAPEFVAPGVLFPPQLAGSIGDYDGRKSCIVAL